MSENIVNELKAFFPEHKFCAIYFKSPNGLSNLKFHLLWFHERTQTYIPTHRVLDDDKFFSYLYKTQKIGKNELLNWIDRNKMKKEEIQLKENLKVIMTRPF